MRILSLFVALFCVTVCFAEDKVNEQPSGEKVTANKPVLEEKPVAPRVPELHEHPTIVAMLNVNNECRRQVGLAPHRISPELTKAAQDHANYMAATGDFQHYSNGGPYGRAVKYGFPGGTGLENIAMGQWDVNSAFNTWRGSGAHWASIVSGTSHAGFGHAIGPGGASYWVGTYGNGIVVSATPTVAPTTIAAVTPVTAVAPVLATTPAVVATPVVVLKPVVAATPASTVVKSGATYPTGTYPVGTVIREGKVYYPAGTVFNANGLPIIR